VELDKVSGKGRQFSKHHPLPDETKYRIPDRNGRAYSETSLISG
jgi:hypothetical protein